MGFIFGGGTYYLLARKSVGAEGRRTPKPVARVLDLSDGPVIVIDRPAHLAK
jgi:hypothetical protein